MSAKKKPEEYVVSQYRFPVKGDWCHLEYSGTAPIIISTITSSGEVVEFGVIETGAGEAYLDFPDDVVEVELSSMARFRIRYRFHPVDPRPVVDSESMAVQAVGHTTDPAVQQMLAMERMIQARYEARSAPGIEIQDFVDEDLYEDYPFSAEDPEIEEVQHDQDEREKDDQGGSEKEVGHETEGEGA